MKLSVRHRTHYRYSVAASQSLNQICLIPRDTTTQRCLQAAVVVTPAPNSIDRRVDQYGNSLATFNLNSAHKECDIIVTSLVDTLDTPARLPASAPVDTNVSLLKDLHDQDALMARDCLLSSPSIPMDYSVDPIIAELPIGETPVLEYATMLMNHIYTTFTYESGFSTLVTPLTDIIAARKGVCQDFAHLAIAVLRRQNVPVRYVSGYLETLPPPGEKKTARRRCIARLVCRVLCKQRLA